MKSLLDILDYVKYNNDWALCVYSHLSVTPSYVSIRTLSLQLSFEISRYNTNILSYENLKTIYEKLKELNFKLENSNILELYSLKILFDDIEQFNLLKEWLETYLIAIKLSPKKGVKLIGDGMGLEEIRKK